jgi:hypothetical protein
VEDSALQSCQIDVFEECLVLAGLFLHVSIEDIHTSWFQCLLEIS